MDMQDCLSTGKMLLIENIEEDLDPILDPLLDKRFVKQAGGLMLRLGDKEVKPDSWSALSSMSSQPH